MTAVVTPPAVSVKMPSVSASSWMPETISTSETSSAQPPVLADHLRGGGAVGGVADGERAGDGVGPLRHRCRRVPALTATEMGEQPVACAPKKRTGLSSTRPREMSSLKALRILRISEPPAMGTDDVVGQAPAELLGDLVADGLRAFGVVGAEVDVDEAPVVLVGDQRAEAVDVVVVAVDADEARAVDQRVEDLGGLEIGGDEDAGLEAEARGLRGDGVGEVAGGGAADGVEAELRALASATETTRSLKLSVGKQTASFLT